jgi:hypothetical protein
MRSTGKAGLKALAMCVVLAIRAVSAQSAAPREVKVAVDPRSTPEAQSHLITKGFQDECPNVSVVRDEAQADYIVLASESDPWRGFLLHYYITVYDKQGKVVFATDKHHGREASKEACRFINGAH